MTSSDRSVEELKSLVVHTLEANGVLGQIRAQLRANVYKAIDSEDDGQSGSAGPAKLTKSPVGRLMAELVAEFFEYYEFEHSLSVFIHESKLGRDRRSRGEIAFDLGLGRVRPDASVLEQLVGPDGSSTLRKGASVSDDINPSSAVSTTTSTPRPDTASALAQRAPAKAAAESMKLAVSIIRAAGLRHMNNFVPDAPYCVCQVLRTDKHLKQLKCQTRSLSGSLSPEWNEDLSLDGWTVGESLEFMIYDKGPLGSKVEGRCTLASARFWPQGFDGEVEMIGCPGAKLHVRVCPPGVTLFQSHAATHSAVAIQSHASAPVGHASGKLLLPSLQASASPSGEAGHSTSFGDSMDESREDMLRLQQIDRQIARHAKVTHDKATLGTHPHAKASAPAPAVVEPQSQPEASTSPHGSSVSASRSPAARSASEAHSSPQSVASASDASPLSPQRLGGGLIRGNDMSGSAAAEEDANESIHDTSMSIDGSAGSSGSLDLTGGPSVPPRSDPLRGGAATVLPPQRSSPHSSASGRVPLASAGAGNVVDDVEEESIEEDVSGGSSIEGFQESEVNLSGSDGNF